MPAKRDPRTGHWFFRKMVKLPDGTKRRIYGVALDYGQKNERQGAEEAERIAITRIRETGSLDLDPKPAGPAAPAKEVPTFAEFSKDWIAQAQADNAPETLKLKQFVLKHHFLPAFGSLRLDKIDSDAIETWRLKAINDNKLMATTVSRYLGNLRGLMGYAQRRGKLEKIPTFPRLKLPPQKFDFFTFEEVDRLLAAAKGEWKAMILVAARTGLRHGELIALTWDAVDFAAGRLHVNVQRVNGVTKLPKGEKVRDVPLSNDALRALVALRAARGTERGGDLVFCSDAGRYLRHKNTDRKLRGICRRAGLREIGWHTLRHTFASHLAMRGVTLKAIQELLGHANIKMTMRYAHLSPEVRRDAVLLLDAPPPARPTVATTEATTSAATMPDAA